MISAEPPDERLHVRKDTYPTWKKDAHAGKPVYIASLTAREGGYAGFVMIDDAADKVLEVSIPTKAGKEQALKRAREWLAKQKLNRGEPTKIEWHFRFYRLHWPVSAQQNALLGPFILSVPIGEGEPRLNERR